MTTDDSMSANSHSITRMIQRLQEEDPDAVDEIWQRYFGRLIPLARARLKALSNRTIDEEDILVSVFDRFFSSGPGEPLRAIGEQG